MDSWTDKQLALMKNGGNDKCNEYLKRNGIDARTPIKQKYESPVAQLYKEVLKAGRRENHGGKQCDQEQAGDGNGDLISSGKL